MNVSQVSSKLVAMFTILSMGVVLFSGVAGAQESDVAIEVNGEVVEKSEIQSRIDRMTERMEQRYGDQAESEEMKNRLQEQAKQQVVDQTVQQLVLKTHARNADVSVSGEQVEKELQSTIERFPSEEAFQKALDEEGMTVDEFRSQIQESLVVENFLEEKLGEVKVSDEEARSFYEENKQRFQDRSFEDMKSSIKQSLEQRKKQEQRQSLVSQLKEESEIDIRI